MSTRLLIGSLLLAAQIVMIVAARFHPMRYFCWAPFDSQNEYEIHVVVGRHELSPEDVRARYRLPTPGRNPRMIYQVTDVIRYVEEHYHELDPARVEVVYRTNGGEEQAWHWPSP